MWRTNLFFVIIMYLLTGSTGFEDTTTSTYFELQEDPMVTMVEVDEPDKPAMVSARLEGNTDNCMLVNTYDYDTYSSEVVGMQGVPIKVYSNDWENAQDNLSLVFVYDEAELECKEEDLGILWYNQDEGWYETIAEYEIDSDQNEVRVSVNQLGTYILEDMDTWVSIWTGTYDYSAYEPKEPVCHWHNEFDFKDIETLADISLYTEDTTEYHITTVEQLAGLVKLVNEGKSFAGCDFYLDADLDLAGYKWVPIGWYYPADEEYAGKDFPFEGKFYGNGHAIYNMKIVNPDQSDLGLFGRTLQGFEVHDLAVIDCYVEGKFYNGGILGDNINYGDHYDMTNCVISGTVKGRSKSGALVGSSAYLRIKDCTAVMTPKSISELTGDLRGGYIENSSSNELTIEEALAQFEANLEE